MDFKNYAGRVDVDNKLKVELALAGIPHIICNINKDQEEVKSGVRGYIIPCYDMITCVWFFRRAWRYWVARGPGIPYQYAEKLYQNYRDTVRIDGLATSRSPMHYNKGFAVSLYHVDSFEGLKALADTIKQIPKDAGFET